MKLRKELQKFVQLQESILKQNDNKRNWKNYSNNYLLSKLRDEVSELEDALIDGNTKEIQHECADVANFAMMMADNAGR